jgi:hypothetical protein
MRRPSTGMMLAGGLVAVLIGLVVARRSAGVTGRRIEDAVAPTFANLIHVQRAILGLPAAEASTFRATAQCHKVGTTKETDGAGDWTCTVLWFTPGQRTPLHDTYDLSVTTDGCYTATADGAEAHIGGPTLPTREGETITNLLYTFEGCFDVSGGVGVP